MRCLFALSFLLTGMINAGEPETSSLVADIRQVRNDVISIRNHRVTYTWYLGAIRSGTATIRLLERGRSDYVSPQINGLDRFVETPTGFGFFGKSGLIVYSNGKKLTDIDTLPFADRVLSLVVSSDESAYAIIENGGRTYMATRRQGAWGKAPQQLLVKQADETMQPTVMNWLLILLLVLGSASAICYTQLHRRRQVIRKLREEIRERENPVFTKADVPLNAGDEDLLGFSTIEDAIVNVIKNPATALPLSIVISGKWGSGKSSMMNRIRQKLDAQEGTRFKTTWFNAWHFQGEKSLLDTFLISMVKFYETTSFGFFSPFRIRLFRNKLLRFSFLRQTLFWFTFSLISLTLILILYNFFGASGSSQFLLDCQNRVYNLAKGELPWTGLSVYTKVVLGALSVISVVFLRKEFSPAGFIELLNLQQFRIDAEKQAVGHKEKFKQDFWEIIAASDKRQRVVVFIDDIDRISGEKILELLEAINFISDIASAPQGPQSTGNEFPRSNMIFVLGMATTEVARNLGAQLKRISQVQDSEEKIGLNYIEKMVQLVVSVPYDESGEKLKTLIER